MSGGAGVFLLLLSLGWIVPAWWLGASNVSGQCVLLALGGAALFAAWRRRFSVARLDAARAEAETGMTGRGGRPAAASAPAQNGRRRLARWAFGASAVFLVYVLVQALNPAFGFVPGWPIGRLFDIPHAEWLPSGMATPFAEQAKRGIGATPYENPWRYLLVFGGTAALVWAGVIGLRRTSLVRRWLEVMLAHGVLFSAVALAHNVSGSRLTYWFLYDPANRLGGPQFPNGNQQGAYQVLLLALALAAVFARGGARVFPQLRWRGVWLSAAVALVWLGLMSGRHRAGLLLGAGLGVFALALAWRRLRGRWRVWLAGGAAALAGAAALGVAVVPSLRENAGRFGEFAENPSGLLRGGSFRPLQHETAWLMAKDARWYGWGGGCYLYLFEKYYPQVPRLAEALERQRLNHIVFPHADGDWLEFLAEYGMIGMALLVTPLVCWLGWLLPRMGRIGAESWVLAAGVACVLAQATIDPVLRNPMVLSAAAAAAWLSVRLHRIAGMRERRRRGGSASEENPEGLEMGGAEDVPIAQIPDFRGRGGTGEKDP